MIDGACAIRSATCPGDDGCVSLFPADQAFENIPTAASQLDRGNAEDAGRRP
jgi:hypothetical protein